MYLKFEYAFYGLDLSAWTTLKPEELQTLLQYSGKELRRLRLAGLVAVTNELVNCLQQRNSNLERLYLSQNPKFTQLGTFTIPFTLSHLTHLTINAQPQLQQIHFTSRCLQHLIIRACLHLYWLRFITPKLQTILLASLSNLMELNCQSDLWPSLSALAYFKFKRDPRIILEIQDLIILLEYSVRLKEQFRNPREKLLSLAWLYAAQCGDSGTLLQIYQTQFYLFRDIPRDEEGNTALHLAVRYHHINVVQVLFELELLPQLLACINKQKQTPLSLAAAEGQVIILNYLIKQIMDSDQIKDLISRKSFLISWGELAETILQATQFFNSLQMPEYPLKQEKLVSLWQAVHRRDTKLVIELATSELIQMPLEKHYILTKAIICGHDNIVTILLERKAEITFKIPPHDITPLTLASGLGLTNIAKQLIMAKAEIDEKSGDCTPLCSAAMENHISIAHELIKCNAAINQPDGHFISWSSSATGLYTPLHRAASRNFFSIMFLLIQAKAEINPRNHYDETPLYLAVSTGQHFAVQMLIEAKANLEQIDYLGYAPLHASKTPLIQRLLLDAKVDANQRVHTPLLRMRDTDRDNWTPLHFASACGDVSFAKLLLVFKANVNAKEFTHKMTPLHEAILKGHINMVKLLLSADADVNMIAENRKLKTTTSYPGQSATKFSPKYGPHTVTSYPQHNAYEMAESGSDTQIKFLLQQHKENPQTVLAELKAKWEISESRDQKSSLEPSALSQARLFPGASEKKTQHIIPSLDVKHQPRFFASSTQIQSTSSIPLLILTDKTGKGSQRFREAKAVADANSLFAVCFAGLQQYRLTALHCYHINNIVALRHFLATKLTDYRDHFATPDLNYQQLVLKLLTEGVSLGSRLFGYSTNIMSRLLAIRENTLTETKSKHDTDINLTVVPAFAQYAEMLIQDDDFTGGEIELRLLSQCFRLQIVVYQQHQRQARLIIQPPKITEEKQLTSMTQELDTLYLYSRSQGHHYQRLQVETQTSLQRPRRQSSPAMLAARSSNRKPPSIRRSHSAFFSSHSLTSTPIISKHDNDNKTRHYYQQ